MKISSHSPPRPQKFSTDSSGRYEKHDPLRPPASSLPPPIKAIKEWIPDDDPDLNWFNQQRDPTGSEIENYDQPVRRSLLTAIALQATAVGEGVSLTWQPKEIPLGDGRILVLDDS